jgi:hypothetical protein
MEHTQSSKNSPSGYGAGNATGRRQRASKLPPPPQPGSFLAWMEKFENGWDTFRLAGRK